MPMPGSEPIAVGEADHADTMENAAVSANVHPLGKCATCRVAVIPAHPIRVAAEAPELGAGRLRPRSGGLGNAGAAGANKTDQAGSGKCEQDLALHDLLL